MAINYTNSKKPALTTVQKPCREKPSAAHVHNDNTVHCLKTDKDVVTLAVDRLTPKSMGVYGSL